MTHGGVRGHRRCSGIIGLIAAGGLVATMAPAAVADGTENRGSATTRESGPSYGNLWNILPPGSNGNVTAAALAGLGSSTATPTNPPHFADQLEMYDALTKQKPGSITQADLDRLYKHEDFTPA